MNMKHKSTSKTTCGHILVIYGYLSLLESLEKRGINKYTTRQELNIQVHLESDFLQQPITIGGTDKQTMIRNILLTNTKAMFRLPL